MQKHILQIVYCSTLSHTHTTYINSCFPSMQLLFRSNKSFGLHLSERFLSSCCINAAVMSNILHFLMAIKLAAAYVEQMQTRIILKSDVEFNI